MMLIKLLGHVVFGAIALTTGIISMATVMMACHILYLLGAGTYAGELPEVLALLWRGVTNNWNDILEVAIYLSCSWYVLRKYYTSVEAA